MELNLKKDGKDKSYPGADFDRRWRELVFPASYRNPEPRRKYNLVVIGAGPGPVWWPRLQRRDWAPAWRWWSGRPWAAIA